MVELGLTVLDAQPARKWIVAALGVVKEQQPVRLHLPQCVCNMYITQSCMTTCNCLCTHRMVVLRQLAQILGEAVTTASCSQATTAHVRTTA